MKRQRIALFAFSFLFVLFIVSSPKARGQSTFRILLGNDDGIDAPGLAALVEKLSPLGSVFVAAPRNDQSGASHSLTSNTLIKVEEIDKAGAKWYVIDARPATCIRLAIESLLPAKPDIVVAGINRGDTTGVVSYFSATVACAREAAITGLPALAVHLEKSPSMDYQWAAEFVASLVAEVKDKKLPPGVFLNINIPALPKDRIRGVLITTQDLRGTIQLYEKRVDAAGLVSYWPGYKHLGPDKEGTDITVLANGYISITPLQLDQTASAMIAPLKTWAITKWKTPGR